MANRIHCWQFLLNENGEPVEDANIYIYQAGTTTPVWYYENRNTGLPYKSYDVGTGSDSNLKLIQTDAQGYFEFYLSYDSNDDQSYDPTVKFKISWEKAGIADGTLDQLDLLPISIPVDETDTDETKNKLVSNYLASRWEATANLTSPEISANADALFDVWNHITSAGQLDDTPIGMNTPTSGAFTLLSCTTDPVTGDHVGNRDYNDSRYTLTSDMSTHEADTSTHGVTEILGSIESQSVQYKEIDSSIIGQTTPSAGAFTTLECDDPTGDTHVGDRGYNDLRYANLDTYSAHVTATSGLHGVGAGDVVGTTLTQNVTNKAVTNSTVGYNASGTLTNPSSGGFSYLLAQSGVLNNVTIGNSVKGSGGFSSVDIDGGNIDGTVIGDSTPSSGSFSYVDINDGYIDDVTLGDTTPCVGTFSNVTINGGNIDGTVIGGSVQTSGSFSHIQGSSLDVTDGDFSTLTVTNLSASNFTLNEINNTPIGSTNPDIGYFTFLNTEYADIDGGLIDNTEIGRTTPAAGTFTTLSVDNLLSYDLSGGTINATPIGNDIAASANFTDLYAVTISAGVATLSQAVIADLQASEINNVVIGNTTPTSGSFSLLFASGGTLNDVTLNSPVLSMATMDLTGGNLSNVKINTDSLSASNAVLTDATGNSADWTMTGGSINGTPIGLTDPKNANFLTVNMEYADIDSGRMDNCLIGDSIPASGTFDTLTVNNATKLVGAYSTDLNGMTFRDAQIKDDGTIGYDSSALRGKTNIKDIEDTSWLFDLRPVNYEPKKQISNQYIEESTGIKEYGLIAEEVENVNNHFVFYDKDGEIAGVHYKKLITPMLNEIIRLRKEIEELKKPKKRTYKKRTTKKSKEEKTENN